MKSLVITMTLLSTFFLTSCKSNVGNFELINKSDETISTASVSICGQTVDLKEIEIGKSAKGSYTVKTDSHYSIKIEFQSGKKLEKNIGYVTHGMDYSHKITVTSSTIEITDTKVK